MRVSILGSGSRGNSILVLGGETIVLVDAGFSAKALADRLRTVGVAPDSVDAILITHDHRDHTQGVGVFSRRHGTPVYLTEATLRACNPLFNGGEEIRTYRAGFPFSIGSLTVEPFLTAHDARDPVAVALTHQGTGLKLGIATDLGKPTTQVRHALSNSHFLILEANHDPSLLHLGPYPASVKSRIASSHGHLSNEAAAHLALDLLHSGLAGVVLAHLSAECNRPELAAGVVGKAIRAAGYRGLLEVAEQDVPTPLMDVEKLHRRLEPDQLPLI